MKDTNVKKFHYKSTRDIAKTAIIGGCALVGIIILNVLLGLFREADMVSRSSMSTIRTMYILIIVAFVIVRALKIYVRTYSTLSVGNGEIVYTTGFLKRTTTTIPMVKVLSCSKNSTMLQRACGTMTIAVTTAGDKSEICFPNLEKAEEAYKLISQQVKS